MVEIINGSKSYKDVCVWEHLNLEINTGLFYIIHGTSGCGKTTLLNVISGFESLDQGKIYFEGKEYPKPFRNKKMLREDISIVFQDFLLIPQQTVSENLMIALEYSGLTKIEKKLSIRNALREIDLEHKLDADVSSLSGGQQQKVALMRAVLKKHKILILDEPTGNLDEQSTQNIMSLLQTYKTKSKTIVMVTHDTSLFQYADVLINIEEFKIEKENLN